jgi:hypothetical protein
MVKNSNPFTALCIDEVADVARNMGVCLGPDQDSRCVSANEIVMLDVSRGSSFRDSCKPCHEVKVEECLDGDDPGVGGDGAPHTPEAHLLKPLVEGDSDMGQWTVVVNKKKTKPKVSNERDILEH